MAEQADARRMNLLEALVKRSEPQDIDDLAKNLDCDARTIRRDIEHLQNLLQIARGVEIKRGKAGVTRSGFTSGYFTDQLERSSATKERLARAIVRSLPENSAIALTAGSTTYAVAREMKRIAIADIPPHNLIVFTNSLPALLELIAANVSTGILGEIYAPDDCAFHTPEFHSAFQPSLAIVGASGVLFGAGAQGLDLFTHRAEEAAFLKQLLKGIPEIVIAADSGKLGKRHPWSFGGAALSGKTIRLVTDALTPDQQKSLDQLTPRLAQQGIAFRYEIALSDSE